MFWHSWHSIILWKCRDFWASSSIDRNRPQVRLLAEEQLYFPQLLLVRSKIIYNSPLKIYIYKRNLQLLFFCSILVLASVELGLSLEYLQCWIWLNQRKQWIFSILFVKCVLRGRTWSKLRLVIVFTFDLRFIQHVYRHETWLTDEMR